MSMNWIEAFYLQSLELKATLTPGHEAPQTTVGSFSLENVISAQEPQPRALEPTLEPQQLTLPGFESALPVNNMGDTGMSVLIEGSTEKH